MTEPIRHHLTEAVENQAPTDAQDGDESPFAKGASPEDLREQGQAHTQGNEHSRDRKDHLIHIGRAEETAGRQGQ